MTGKTNTGPDGWRQLALYVIALALAFRLLIPPGFMPASEPGYALTLCTGDGMVSGWIDSAGTFHKDGKPPAEKSDHPCAFAGLGPAIDQSPSNARLSLLAAGAATSYWVRGAPARLGHGLAAPPPPSTGPPITT